jgi:hypothetical protein
VLFYIFVIMSIIALSMSICVMDGYIKCSKRISDFDLTFSSEIATDLGLMIFIENCIDLGSLLRIQAIVLPIICWSLYYSLGKKKSTTTLNAIVEVLPFSEVKMVSREKAKKNLHKIRETNAKRRIENVLFDKFWYINRELK